MPALQFSINGNSNIFFLLLGYGITAYAALKYKVNFITKRFLLVVTIIAIWTVFQKIMHPSYFSFSPFILLEIFLAYVIIYVYKDTLFRRFEDVTYILSFIGIIGWILSIIAHPLMSFIANTIGCVADGERAKTIYLYTVDMMGSLRNSGFAWEPGKTACMICVGLLFYLMRTNLNLLTKRFWIMIFCLITTMSTTGFCTFIVMIIMCFLSMRRMNPIILIFIGVTTISFFSLPFMYNKLTDLVDQASESSMIRMANNLEWDKEHYNEFDRDFYVPQRFEGIAFSYMNFQNSDKLIGDGRDFRKFYINRVNDWKIKTSEGIIEHSVRYGIILGLISYFLVYRASVGISRMYNVRNNWLFFVVFIMISISYSFWELPLFMAIWMMPIYRCSKYFSFNSIIQHKRKISFC